MLQRSDFFPYQDRGEQFIVDHPNCMMLQDPGLGKTIQTLSAYRRMLDSFDVRRMLVTAPLRVARKVWRDEINEWAHLQGLSISCITGTKAEKVAALRKPADIHTINVEAVPWLAAQFDQGKKQIKPWPWDMVALDECQLYRSQTSERWKAMNLLRRLFTRLVGLTGSLIPNGYQNIWAQYALLSRPGEIMPLGNTEQAFLERFFEEPTRHNGLERPKLRVGAKEEIQRLIAPITLSMRAKDYLSLPPVRVNKIRVELPPSLVKRYKKFAREYVLELKSQRVITAVNAGVLHGKLLQLSSGAIYVDDKGAFEVLHNAKLEALEEQLETLSVRGPVLIAYNFISSLKRMQPVLDRYCGQNKSWSILKSDASFEKWARGEIDFGLVHPKSAGHGLNDVYKSGCQDLLHFDLGPDFELYDQVNKRLTGGHRVIGRDVCIHHIITEETQDVGTYALLTGKEIDQADLTDAMARLTTQL